jgi:hypothetical protein
MKMQKRERFLGELQKTMRMARTLGAGACAAFASLSVSALAQDPLAQDPQSVSLAGHRTAANATKQCDTKPCDDPAGGTSASTSANGACDSLGASSAADTSCVLFPALGAKRKEWEQSGFTLQNNLTQFYFGNTSGGVERDFR